MLSIAAVSKVLYDLWDPIDIRSWCTATDEYDDWAPQVIAMLDAGLDRVELAKGLDRILLEMGLRPMTERSNKAAAALVRLRDGADRGSLNGFDG